MTTSRWIILGILGLCTTPFASAQINRYVAVSSDPHLHVIPRTHDEMSRIAAVIAPPDTFHVAQPFELRSGGAATVNEGRAGTIFSRPSANMTHEDRMNFSIGEAMFEKLWVFSPSSTLASDGLGPIYNARSCASCHIGDGRGHTPVSAEDSAISLVLRVSMDDPDADTFGIQGYHATIPHTVYGEQLQDLSQPGIEPEYRLEVTYDEFDVALSGGETATLRKPTYHTEDLRYGPLGADTMISPRVAPQMIGLGLLEAIPAEDILALSDPDDVDGDGISGRPNIVWSMEFQQPMLGRFGLKAGMPTLYQQNAAAFAGDIGISNYLFPEGAGDCTQSQSTCINALHGDGDDRVFEINQQMLELVTYFTRNLAVPARRDVDHPEVLRGKEMFQSAGCAACHQPAFVTHRLEGQPEQSFQLIWPYTDLLLHDMGPGLADNRPEGVANGQEWRTPPLWGIGLTEEVSGHTQFLHDGRARNLLEAILWHGGEGQAARDAVVAMSPNDRAALLRFLESL